MTPPSVPTESNRPPLVLNQEQVNCLTSPLKRDILEALLTIGPASIAELTAYMGRAPKSLYYHVRQLCAVGLLQVRETRMAGKRQEAIYEPTSDRIHIEEETTDASYREAALQSQRALLRKMERELRTASGSEASGEAADVLVIRVIAWLTPEARSRLQEMLEAAAGFLREQDDPQRGERTTLTTFVTTQPPKFTGNQAGTRASQGEPDGDGAGRVAAPEMET